MQHGQKSTKLISVVVSIPFFVLWKASMSIKQRLGLSVFLTMNVWLIVIALVRVISFKQGGITWYLFFQFLEPNVAILASCFTAFRSIFVSNGSKARREQDRPSNSLQQRLFRNTPLDHQPLDDLPTIPGATLTGMRTAIWNNNRTNPTTTNDRDSAASGQGFVDLGGGIHVKHDWSLDPTRV
jgi:hypothetical protein